MAKREPKVIVPRPIEVDGKRVPPPHDLPTEEVVISSLVLETTVDLVRDILPDANAFFGDATRWLYRAICALDDERKSIDVVTLRRWLEDNGKLQVVGGASEIVRIVDMTPSKGHVQTHAKTVRDKWMIRQAIARAQLIQAEGYHDDVGDVEAWLAQSTNAFDEITSNTTAHDMNATGMHALMTNMAQCLQSPEKDTSVKLYTGMRDVDRLLGSMHEKSVVVIGAHPGIGKTSLARNISINVAKSVRRVCPVCDANVDITDRRCVEHPNETPKMLKNGVLYFTRETKKEVVSQMAALSMARIDINTVTYEGGVPRLHAEQMRRLTDAMVMLSKLPLHFIDDVYDMVTLRQRARMYKRALEAIGVRVAMIVIDYAQFMMASLNDNLELRERIVAVSKASVNLAHELSCVVALLSQLNNDARSSGRAPEIQDLAESKTLEQDANQIILIDNQDMLERRRSQVAYQHAPDNIAPVIDCADIIVGKNRGGGLGGGGRTGKVQAAFFPAYTQFEDWPDHMEKPERVPREKKGRR